MSRPVTNQMSRSPARPLSKQTPKSTSKPPTRQTGSRPTASRQTRRPGLRPITSESGLSGGQISVLGRFPHQLTPLSEGQSEESLDIDVSRKAYLPTGDKHLLNRLAALKEYLERVKVEDAFHEACQDLLSQAELPYNPYPSLVQRMREWAERFHITMPELEDILQNIVQPVQTTHIAYIVRPPSTMHIWGLETLISHLDHQHILQFQSLLSSVSPDRAALVSDVDYSNQATAALIGPAVFTGTFYPHCNYITVRLEYLITGPEVEMALQLFVDSVILHMKRLHTDGVHIFLNARAGGQLWKMETIQELQDEFWKLLEESVTAKEYIIAECVFCLDEGGHRYIKGQVEYGLNVIQLGGEDQQETLLTFTELPLSTLHEGVFMKQHHAESYLAVFTPRLSIIDPDTPDNRADPEDTSQRRGFLLGRPNRKHKPNKVTTDGFRQGPQTGYSPDAWQITTPIKNFWQQKMVSLHREAQFYDILHCALLLCLMDRETYGHELKAEVFRLLHGTGALMFDLMQRNRLLRDLVVKYKGSLRSAVVDSLFGQYTEQIDAVFDDMVQERSSDLLQAKRSISSQLEGVLEQEEDGLEQHVLLNDKTHSILTEVNHYCATLMLQLVEDLDPWYPQLKKLLEMAEASFPEHVLRPQTRIKQRTGEQDGFRQVDQEEVFKHGVEDPNIMRHDRQVLDVQACIEQDRASKLISKESVLMQYILDTHLDEIWMSYLVDLMAREYLPPNPFPQLVTTLRRAAMKMDLCYEEDEVLCDRLLHGSARVEAPSHYVWHIPGCDAHGHKSALSVVDTGHFFQLAPMVQNFINTNFRQRSGPYRFAICLAISGHSPLYGRVAPYLNYVEIHEHCYIRGPTGCQGEALQLYSSLIYHNMWELHRLDQFPILGMFMGYEEKRWPLHQIAERKKGFASDFERFLENQEPIYLKSYMQWDWRYIPVLKYYKLHFINEEETEHKLFFKEDTSTLHQNVFFDTEKAAFNFQHGGTPDCSDPFNSTNRRRASNSCDHHIHEASHRHDWLSVHRWLLTKNLLNQGTSHIPDTWRMLHSSASQLEYVLSLLSSMQDLVRFSQEEVVRQQEKEEQEQDADQSQGRPESQETTKPGNRIGCLDLEVLGRMTLALRRLTDDVCQRQCMMAPESLPNIIRIKMFTITERDPVTRELMPVLDMKTVETLHEVKGMLRVLMDSAAADVHATCPAAQAAVRSIQAELPARPSSVASVHLNQPDLYLTKPRVRGDPLDDWTHI